MFFEHCAFFGGLYLKAGVLDLLANLIRGVIVFVRPGSIEVFAPLLSFLREVIATVGRQLRS